MNHKSCQKAMARPEPKLQAVEIYSHSSASASYFISALVRTSSTLYSPASVSNGIGTTLSTFIVGLGPSIFSVVIKQTTNCTVAYAGHCSQCSWIFIITKLANETTHTARMSLIG